MLLPVAMAAATSLCVIASVCAHSTNGLIQTISGPLRNKINFKHRLQREEDGGLGGAMPTHKGKHFCRGPLGSHKLLTCFNRCPGVAHLPLDHCKHLVCPRVP